MRWVDGLMPNFSNRCLKVFGWRPRVFAAPFAPSMTPRVSCSTAMMCARSISRKVLRGDGVVEGDASLGSLTTSGRTGDTKVLLKSPSKLRIGPFARISDRSITFCSSRTLPGHEYFVSISVAAAEIPSILFPKFRAYLDRKNIAS